MESNNVACQESPALMSDLHKNWVGMEDAAEEFGAKIAIPSETINEKDPVTVRDSNSKDEANSLPHGMPKASFKLPGINISSTKDTLHQMWSRYHKRTEDKDLKYPDCCEKSTPRANVGSKFSTTKGALLQRIGFGRDFNEGRGCETKDVENKEPPPPTDAGIKKTVDWSQTKETIQRLSLSLTKTAAARAEPVRKSWNQFIDDVKEHQKYRNSIDSQFTDRQRQESLTDVLVPPRKGYSIPFAVPPGSTISWRFRVKEHDIGFTVSLRTQAIGGAQEEELFPSFRFEAGVTYQGSWKAPEYENSTSKDVHRIVLLWDNSYSYVRSKTIAYSVEIRAEPLEEEHLLSMSSSDSGIENIATTDTPLVVHEKHNSAFYASPVSNEITI